MIEGRSDSAAAKFEGDDSIWWVTGGGDSISNRKSTENFNRIKFSYGADLPKDMKNHNLVNVNSTHMVLLGGYHYSDEVFIFDR